MPPIRDHPIERLAGEFVSRAMGVDWVRLATRNPLIRWNRSRAVKTPDSTIASY